MDNDFSAEEITLSTNIHTIIRTRSGVLNLAVLVGKLLTESYFNPEATKAVLQNIWKPARGVIIRELDKNLFSFQFFSTADKEHVLNEGPWAFDGHLLLLKEIMGPEQPADVKFDMARFWVKAYSVPPLKQTMGFAKVLGTQLGTFLGCDEANLYCGADKFVNFQVEIDITKPLRRGLRMIVRGKVLWIGLGCLIFVMGHVLKGCDVRDPELDVVDLQYGEWLRASPVKSKKRHTENERQEEQKLFKAFQKNREALKARMQLKFEDPGSQNRNMGLSNHGREDMVMNDEQAVQVGNEVFKRKKQDMVNGRRAGGLALLWLKDVQVTLLLQSSNHVDVEIGGVDGKSGWRFTGVYGWP
ncbi:hypothetical protein Cgig2_000445 [Carnegiea gigantea]|uniref:DUF4283 domain-containing protein n=1 Tax=Carnegiea gigantea TaxID=171969 RepID=A0A9Q1GND3_9CARY|nr:hypothetical protein Cgig2_000445 [Carnegiea gigantea]